MTCFEQIDRALVLYANQLVGRHIVLDRFMDDLAYSTLLKSGVFLAVYWWLWFEADESGVYVQRRKVVVALLAATVVAVVSRLLQVALPMHLRPLHTPDLGLRMPFGVDPLQLNEFGSFPSDHAVLFFALSVPLWVRSRRLGAVAAVWTLLVICLPRLYLGYHWTSDLIGGAVIGVALMLVLCRLIGVTGLPDRVLRFNVKHPPAFYAVAWLFVLELAVLYSDLRAFLLDTARLAGALI
jgi:undecaprenyl-diphosphatase